MKKTAQILSVMLMAVILASAIGSTSAAENQVAYNQVGVRFFDQQKIQAGEMYAAPNGQQVPSSITFTDAAGGKTNYLSIRQIAEMMDADIRWDSASGNVEIAGRPQMDLSDLIITAGGEESSGEADQANRDAAQPREFGQEIGPFEEIDPKTIETVISNNSSPYVRMEDVHIQSEFSIPPLMNTISPELGKYLVYTVTNNGTSSATSSIFRRPTVSYPRAEYFPRVTVAPGETLVRAFKVSEGANPLTYDLYFAFKAGSGSEGPVATDMTVSLEQYP